MNHQRGWGNRPRRNSRLPKKHPFHSRSEAFQTTFRLYKNLMSQTLETLVLYKPRLIVIVPLLVFFLLFFARKTNIVCLLFIVSQMCFKKKNTFLLFVINRFSLFFELLDNQATHITKLSKRYGWIVSTPNHGSLKYSVGPDGREKANSQQQMW